MILSDCRTYIGRRIVRCLCPARLRYF